MSANFAAAFDALRIVMLNAAPMMVVARDEPGNLLLQATWTEKRKTVPFFFGQVMVRKSYVAFHLMPLYYCPQLESHVTEALRVRRQGKTCFNVKRIDEIVCTDLRHLTEQCAALDSEVRRLLGAPQAPPGCA